MLKSFPVERQLDLKDCGPACLKIISKHYGKYYSLQYLRDKCGTSREGVSFLDISYAAESIGLRTHSIQCSFNTLSETVPLPALIHWNNSHFVVVYKVTKSKVYVSDPAIGLQSYDYSEFLSKWYRPNEQIGSIMAFEPMADFRQREINEKMERKKTIESFFRYFTPYKKNFATIGLVMLISTLLQALLPFISKAVIDIGIHTKDLPFINMVLIANITIILTIMFSNMVRDWVLLHITSRVNIAIISDYLIKLMRLPISFFENKLLGDILQRANDHERIRSFIMNNGLNIIFSTLTFFIFSIILLIFNSIIFYIFIFGSTLYVLWVLLFVKMRKKLDWEYFELNSKNQSFWVEAINGIADIKINNYETKKRWKWEKIQARLYKVNARTLSLANVQNVGAQGIDNLKNLAITFFCAKAVIAGDITFGVMVSTQFIIGMLNGPVSQFIQFIVGAQLAQISFLRLNEIHQLKNEDEDVGENEISLPKDKSIIIRNLTFQYTPVSKPILRNINLIIPQGKMTAIVGDSGSGKSTLLKLVLRLYKPTYGEIQIGNMNVNNISLKQWRDKCGAVMQDGRIFNDTIMNNIVLDDDNVNTKKLKHAVEAANITEEIEALPLGYQTKIGENGSGLSGGQKQRILIARALYKKPDYLFFDEATNSLDTINEQKIVQAMERVFQGRTVVVIAHRLSTIQKADQIVVMQNGSIVELGTHQSLVAMKGRYYELVKSQSSITTIES